MEHLPAILDQRREQCDFLTELFLSDAPVSFLRLGDGELRFLLDWQNGRDLRYNFRHMADQCRLNEADLPRLIRAYERCDFLDEYLRFHFNAEHARELKFSPKANQLRCSSPSTCNIIFEWAQNGLRDLISKKRTLFFGGEAGLLGCLAGDEAFVFAARDVLAPFGFLCERPPGEGRNYWERIDETKDWLSDIIQRNQIEVVLVSLGPLAKILCQELSEELKITMIDFGAALRGLTYSATVSSSTALASHLPVFYRLELEVFGRALAASGMGLSPLERQRKLNRQLLLNFFKRVDGESLNLRFGFGTSFTDAPFDEIQFQRDCETLRQEHRKLSRADRIEASRDLATLFRLFGLWERVPLSNAEKLASRFLAHLRPFSM